MVLTRRSCLLISLLAASCVHVHCVSIDQQLSSDDDTLRFMNTDDITEVDNDSELGDVDDQTTNIDTTMLQGCLMDCLPRDLCCSCKHSRQASMKAAMINDLVKDCTTPGIESSCARNWLIQAFSRPHSGASPCTDEQAVQETLLSCVDTCRDRPLSKPLDPDNLSFTPDEMTDSSELLEYAPVDLTEYCLDMRAEGYLCSNYRGDAYTAGNSLCRDNSRCAFDGYSYSWCYTDYSNNWDYCCTGSCGFAEGTSYMWCKSGTKWQYCGDAGDKSVGNRRCLPDYPCGMHQEKGKAGYYWCYTDTNKNWGYCCQPEDSCSKKGSSYFWCYVGYKKNTKPENCKA